MRHVVVMITTSYPRFPGDGVGSFMEPIAKGVAYAPVLADQAAPRPTAGRQ